jgi:hypothetical protein
MEKIMNNVSPNADLYSNSNSSILDEAVPLKGASHADVVRYTIRVPTQFAECFGVLLDGSKVPLAHKRQFVGWSSRDAKRSLLFESGDYRIEARIDPSDEVGRASPGNISGIEQQPMTGAQQTKLKVAAERCRQYIAIDGGVLSIPAA